jgi:hypothetical protein
MATATLWLLPKFTQLPLDSAPHACVSSVAAYRCAFSPTKKTYYTRSESVLRVLVPLGGIHL